MTNQLPNGVVLRAAGGFFRVMLDDGRVVETRPRGRLRQRQVQILCGDRVAVSVHEDGSGVLEKVKERDTQLHRPSVANVDQVAVVFACANPEPNFQLLDRLLVVVAAAHITPLLCWNKADLVDDETAQELVETYRKAGYDVIVTSATTGQGVDELRTALQGQLSTFAGPSGAGKSALLNAVHPGWERETGAVSERRGLGRHTTRAVELLPLPGGGFVADTPGFSTLDVRNMESAHLGAYWPEMHARAADCRFQRCLHRHEPDCAVRAAVETGDVHPRRYENYLDLLAEIEDWEARRYS